MVISDFMVLRWESGLQRDLNLCEGAANYWQALLSKSSLWLYIDKFWLFNSHSVASPFSGSLHTVAQLLYRGGLYQKHCRHHHLITQSLCALFLSFHNHVRNQVCSKASILQIEKEEDVI